MPSGRPKAELDLTEEERETLQRWARRATTSQALALRSRIVLACGRGLSNKDVADTLKITRPTVGKWRKRFVSRRLDGLLDEPRSGAPRKINDANVEDIVVKTLESKPKNATHWSTRGMAEAVGLSQSSISRIWRAFSLKPHRTDTFKLSTDPQFVEKVRDIVGLYMSPPDKAIVLSIDEKSQVQALDRSQPLLPMEPGRPERHTHDYARHGTTSLFAALNVATGKIISECHQQHRQQEFVKFLEQIDSEIPIESGVEIHLVMDNYATHKTQRVKRWFARHPRYHVHFTPTSSSWLNQVERFFSEITTKRIRRGAFRSVRQLEKAIKDYLNHHNQNPKPFKWTATADKILSRVANVCKRIKDSAS